MMKLKLEFTIRGADFFPKISAQVVLDPYRQSEKTGMPAATRDCDVMREFESELKHLEKQIVEIRKEAERRFLAAGVKV